jgi:hypothetical protein
MTMSSAPRIILRESPSQAEAKDDPVRRAEHKRRVESALKRALKVHAKNLTALAK